MAAKVSGSVTGDLEVAHLLRSLPKIVVNRALGRAGVEAIIPIKESAKKRAKKHRIKRTPAGDHIDENIVIRANRKGKRREFYVTARGAAVKKYHLLEFGTAPHWQPRRQRMHPGARPFPTLRPAFDEHKDDTPKRLAEALDREIEQGLAEELRKMPRRSRR